MSRSSIDGSSPRGPTTCLSQCFRMVGRILTALIYVLHMLVSKCSGQFSRLQSGIAKKDTPELEKKQSQKHSFTKRKDVSDANCDHFDQSALREQFKTIEDLKIYVGELELEKEKFKKKAETIQQQLCKELDGGGSYADGSATPFLLENSTKSLQVAVDTLVKAFQNQFSKVQLDFTDDLLGYYRGAYLSRSTHVKYMLKARIFEIFFKDFENDSFVQGGVTFFLDVDEKKTQCFEWFQRYGKDSNAWPVLKVDTAFREFCTRKMQDFMACWKSSAYYNAIVHQCLTNGEPVHQESPTKTGELEDVSKLTTTFTRAAKAVWSLHKLSHSFEPRAEIFRVGTESKFLEQFMETVESKEDDAKFGSKAGFMICPGFRLRKSIFRCLVYLGAHVEHQNY